MSPDPITLEIISSSLQAISDEMFASIRKTAMSSIIYEVLDMGTAVTDGDGELASSGAGIPGFVGTLDKAVKAIISEHATPGAIAPGDVFATNDPYFGGVNHLNDIIVAMPVFAEGRLIAWTANIAHHNDVGGMVAGSISTEAREIFQEGLRIPAVKIIEAREEIKSVFKLVEANTRLPDLLRGDLWACIAALRLGERRLVAMAEKYGVEAFQAAVSIHLDHGEAVSRRALDDLPKGRFEMAEEQENGSVYKVVVEIADDEFVVDLRENPDQDEGPYNTTRDGAMISAQMIFKSATRGDIAANAGTFRPLRVLTRPGSVFDAQPPAALGIYSEVKIRLHDLIWRCLTEPLGTRLPAGGFSSICGTFISGRHSDTGRHFTIVEPQVGGWGASATADGNSAVFSAAHGDTFNCPAEIAEVRYGLVVDQLALNPEPGGEGAHRGGKGIVVDYRALEGGIFLTCAFTRHQHRPWPVDGGMEGSSNYVEVFRADGSREEFATVSGLPINAGDVIRIHTGNGAGHGNPRDRPTEKVLEDIALEYLSPGQASEVYGVDTSELPARVSMTPTGDHWSR